MLDGDPAPPRKGHSSPAPLFGPCLLWPRSPISATAELLFVCVRNISGTDERICAKFTGKTCLVPRSDEFKFKVNFGCLRAVYVWKNVFALVLNLVDVTNGVSTVRNVVIIGLINIRDKSISQRNFSAY